MQLILCFGVVEEQVKQEGSQPSDSQSVPAVENMDSSREEK